VKFWACFACGILVIFLTNVAIRQVPRFLGIDG